MSEHKLELLISLTLLFTSKLFGISSITRFDHLFRKGTLDLFHKTDLELTPIAITEILDCAH